MTIRGRDILMNAMVIFVTLFTQNRSVGRRTPNLRIVLAVALVACRHNILRQAGSRHRRKSHRTRSHSAAGRPARRSSMRRSGASDALGVGSSVPCLPFIDCPDGTGYVQVASRQLRTQGFSVTVSNLGLPTAVIGRDFELLGRQYDRQILGNFIDQELPLVRQNTTLVTIFAGGNEVNTITAALGGGAGARQSGWVHRSTGGGVRRRLRHAAGRHPQPGERRANRRLERAERRRPAVSRRRVAGAAPGGAARGGRDDDDGDQCAHRPGGHRRRSDVRRAQLSDLELFQRRFSSERLRVRVHRRRGRARRDQRGVSPAARQLPSDDAWFRRREVRDRARTAPNRPGAAAAGRGGARADGAASPTQLAAGIRSGATSVMPPDCCCCFRSAPTPTSC